MNDGNCEVSSNIPCVWIRIYERQEQLNNLKEMEETIEAKDWSAGLKPDRLHVKEEKKAKKSDLHVYIAEFRITDSFVCA